MPSVTYKLDGPVQFVYPHPVQFASEIVLQVMPGTTVPPSEYEVLGAGPDSQAVTIEWSEAPFDGTRELLIGRVVDPDRVADFTKGGIYAEALDAEFDHIYALVLDATDKAKNILAKIKDLLAKVKDLRDQAQYYADLARQWAIKYPDPVKLGQHSAYYWAIQAAKNAEASGVPYFVEQTRFGIKVLSAGASQGVDPYFYFIGHSRYGMWVFVTDDTKVILQQTPPAEHVQLEIMQ